MNGRIRKRSSYSWELTVDLPRRPDGTRKRNYETVKGTKAEAQRRLRYLVAQAEGGFPVNTSKTTLESYFDQWLEKHAQRVRELTIYGYRNNIRRYVIPTLGSTRLIHLEPVAIESLYASLLGIGLSPETVRQTHRILKKALKDAVRLNMLIRNPVDLVEPPSSRRKEILTLDSEQLRRLLSHVQESSYGPVIHLAAHTGMRRGELVGLKWSDIDFDNAMISVNREIIFVPGLGHIVTAPKSDKSRRSIDITRNVVDELRRHKAAQNEHRLRIGVAWIGEDWVFTRLNGQHQAPNSVSRGFKSIREKLELPPVRLHDLRHTHASLMLKSGVHLKVVQERLGHSTIGITADTYSHVAPGLQRAAAEIFEKALSS